MELFLLLAAAFILFGLWNLLIAIAGCIPKFRATAVGTLTKANTKKNVPGRYGTRIPILTRYAYTYTVNGKQYRFSAENRYSKRRLLPKATMVYVKGFPRHAYPDKFKGTNEWLFAFLMLLIGILWLCAICSGM